MLGRTRISIERMVLMNERNKSRWYLLSHMKDLTLEKAVRIYHDRFKIERVFKELKSAGFPIEKSKIKTYDRFKRLLALCMAAPVILVMMGKFIKDTAPTFLKNFPRHGAIMLAYLPLENTLFQPLNQVG